MSTRRKYEDASGVVPLKWERGQPPHGSQGIVLLEVWRMEWNWNDLGVPTVKARIVAAHWHSDSGTWRAMHTNDPAVSGPHQQVRRWARINTDTTSYPSLTLGDWNV